MNGERVLTPQQRARRIRGWIRRRESNLVHRHPVLGYRNAMGSVLFTGSLVGMVTCGWLYATGRVSFLVCILGNAFLASILHEIEHDLIHFLYFRKRRFIHNMMMLGVWAARGNIVNGWYRRQIHLRHHRESGTRTDIEERLLGLGMPWGPKRLLIMIDGLSSYLFNARLLEKEIPGFRRRSLFFAALPFYGMFLLVLGGFLLGHGLAFLHGIGWLSGAGSTWLAARLPWIDVLTVAWVFPNYLRQASLQIVSSNVHYYGDVHGINEETQVLRPFFLWPLQLFCFNFGTTHCLHHYVVDQPFYIRQLVSPWTLPVLKRYGVRINDTGTFARANRYQVAPA